MTLGEKIKFYRKQKNITQRELGEKINATQQQIGQYEKGLRQPKLESIEKIANALGINAWVFYDGYELPTYSEEMLTKKEKNLLYRYRDLDEFGRDTVDLILTREETRYNNYMEKCRQVERLQSSNEGGN